MQMSFSQALITILAITLGVVITRFLPFVLFSNKQMPEKFARLKELIPPAMMGLLVVYCLKGISFTASPYGLPEIISVGAVVGLHLYKRNSLLSIFGGVAVYMALIQLVF